MLRAIERKEDMEQIVTLIKKNIQREVDAAVKPFEERLELQENVNKELFSQVKSLKQELNLIREAVKDQEEYPALQHQHGHLVHQVAEDIGTRHEVWNREGGRRVMDNSESEVLDLCSSARRVVGLSPIDHRMLEIQMESYGAKDIEEAKMMEVKLYLKCELKMLPSEIEKLNIIRIFPSSRENWNTLYVEFESNEEVNTIFSNTKNMVKRDHRVLTWVPRQMYSRFRAVESLAYSIRQEEGLKTRVKIGRTDFILRTKVPNTTVWTTRQLPFNLPKIEVSFQ